MRKICTLMTSTGTKIQVNQDLYSEYMRPIWRERKRKSVRKKHECSLESNIFFLEKLATEEKSLEDLVIEKLMHEKLRFVIKQLSHDEQVLITEIYFYEISERALSQKYSIARKTISYRKKKILSKIKRLLNEDNTQWI